jgi:hypothetical protein
MLGQREFRFLGTAWSRSARPWTGRVPVPGTERPPLEGFFLRKFVPWLLMSLSPWIGLRHLQAAAEGLVCEPSSGYVGTGFVHGPFTPPVQTYSLSNASDTAIDWALEPSQPWISAFESSGRLEAGAATNFTLFPNTLALDLPTGEHVAVVTLTNLTSGAGLALEVQLNLGTPGPAEVEFLERSLVNARQLILSGQPGDPFLVQSSTNLNDWQIVKKGQFEAATATVDFDTEFDAQRYFRALTEGSNAVPARLVLTNAFVKDAQKIRVTGDPGGAYLMESSTNQTDWFPVSVLKVPPSGSLIFTNAQTEENSNRVYRATPSVMVLTDVVHEVLIAGQSLALGVKGSPVLSTEPSPVDFRFVTDGTGGVLSPLREVGVETIASGAARQASLEDLNYRMLFSNVALGGALYGQLKKGTFPYNRGILHIRDAPPALSCLGLRSLPAAIFVVHGEGDHIDPAYGQNIRQWQADYETDIRNVTGQDVAVPMFHSQASAWTSPGNGSASTTLGAFLVLEESELHPDKTILVCPKYYFTYADGIHLTNSSYRWLGEYYGKVYRKVIVEGGTWQPLKPDSIVRTGTNISARFHVPVPPLVLDANLVSDPGRFGFEFYDGTGAPPAITDVQLAEPDRVLITLSAEPLGSNERLRYAYTGIPGNGGGPLTGPRGNLRDSDPELSLEGNTLYNWCVHFDKPVLVKPVE